MATLESPLAVTTAMDAMPGEAMPRVFPAETQGCLYQNIYKRCLTAAAVLEIAPNWTQPECGYILEYYSRRDKILIYTGTC